MPPQRSAGRAERGASERLARGAWRMGMERLSEYPGAIRALSLRAQRSALCADHTSSTLIPSPACNVVSRSAEARPSMPATSMPVVALRLSNSAGAAPAI